MVASKRVIDIPLDTKFVDKDGNISPAWLDWGVTITKVAEKLRDAAENMDDLSFSTDGFATATDIATAWEELRSTLQEIT